MVNLGAKIKALTDRQENILLSLVHAPAASYDEYKRMVGIWQGIQDALDILAEGSAESD